MKCIAGVLFFVLFTTSRSSSVSNDSVIIGPGQMPALAADSKAMLHVVYGSGDSLLYSRSEDKGKSFSKPQTIKVVAGLAANATRGPQIAVTQNGLTVVASTDGGNIFAFTKTGNGEWHESGRVNDVDSVNLEGFVDVASDGGLNLFAVWLDLRGSKRNKLYGARSADGGKTWTSNIKVYESPDSTICECCRTSVAMKGKNVYIMFRNQLYGKRDLHLISSKDAGRSFGLAEKLGRGTWPLDGCPMDGGDMTLSKDGKIQTVWRRESKIYSCEPGRSEIEIGDGKGCTVESVGGEYAFAWVKKGEIVCRLPNGEIKKLGKGNSPDLQSIGANYLLCVWENEKRLFSTTVKL